VNEIDIVRDISRRFDQAGIDYMLTGSMAMNYYAAPRMTRDIDVVVAIGPDDVQRVTGLFQPDYYVSEQNIGESVAQQSIFNLIHNESVIKVDCIVRKASEYRQVEFERRQKISVLDFTTFIVTKEDLIISKQDVCPADTSPEIQRLLRDRLMARSAEERFIMGAEMFEAAREMVKASLRRDLPQAIRKRQLFHRIYGEALPVGEEESRQS
jgi:hypothetical protein